MYASVKKMRRRGNPISISDKLKILEKLDRGAKGTELAAEFGIAKQTVSDIKKSKDRIREYAMKFEISTDSMSNRITLKPPNDKELDESVYHWYVNQRTSGVYVRGVDLQLAAESEAEKLGVVGFVASGGWLWRFRKRHNIKQTYKKKFTDDVSRLAHFSQLAEGNLLYESKGAAIAGNSSYAGFSENVSGAENSHCDDVSVDLSPDQILGDDGDTGRTSITPPTQRPESFKLSHNNHLSLVLDSLASDESFMDVTLTAQGKQIKAHKSVLSAVSPYFKSVLRENPCQHPIIIMPRDITFDQLKNIIAYVYKGEMTVAACELSNLLKTAELLQVSGLSPSETGGAFNDDTNCPQQPSPSKWTNYVSPMQRTVKTPVKSAKPSSKKRNRTPSRNNSPSPKRTQLQTTNESSNEITCVKEELHSGNEFEEVDYQPVNSGVDDPGENSASFSMASEASMDSEERPNQIDPLLISKPELSAEKVFECVYCDKSFMTKSDQELHMRNSHPNKQIYVCICGKSFETPVDLEDHKQSCLMI